MKALLLLAALLLAGCGDERECVQGHTVMRTTRVPVLVGKIVVRIPRQRPVFVCDQWAEQ